MAGTETWDYAVETFAEGPEYYCEIYEIKSSIVKYRSGRYDSRDRARANGEGWLQGFLEGMRIQK